MGKGLATLTKKKYATSRKRCADNTDQSEK